MRYPVLVFIPCEGYGVLQRQQLHIGPSQGDAMSGATQAERDEQIMQTTPPASASALLRHLADLRDGTHGGAKSRRDKERLFAAAVPLLDPHARQALEEINTYLLLGTGEVTATGVRTSADRDIEAIWELSWPEQQAAGIKPLVI